MGYLLVTSKLHGADRQAYFDDRTTDRSYDRQTIVEGSSLTDRQPIGDDDGRQS